MAYKTIGGIGWKDDLDDNFTSLQLIAFAGKNGAGACTATGLAVGDKILSVTGVAAGTVGTQAALFETVYEPLLEAASCFKLSYAALSLTSSV